MLPCPLKCRKVNVRMMTHRRLFLLILFLLVPVWATAQVAEPPMKVLFIGNSYTYVNDLPSLVVGLADAAGGRKIETDQRLPGGYTFQQHVSDKQGHREDPGEEMGRGGPPGPQFGDDP